MICVHQFGIIKKCLDTVDVRYKHEDVYWSSYTSRYSCQILMKLEFSIPTFEKYSNIKFKENPSTESRVVPCGRTDRLEEANCHFSQFCERA